MAGFNGWPTSVGIRKQTVFVGFSHVLGNVLGIYRPFSAPSCSLRAFKPRFDYWDDL